MNTTMKSTTINPENVLSPAQPISALPRHIPLASRSTSPGHSPITYSIRPHVKTDIPQLVIGLNDQRLTRWMTNRIALPYTEELGRGFLDHLDEAERTGQGRWDFAIVEHSSDGVVDADADEGGRLVGGIGLKLNDPKEIHARTVELGYWLGVGDWGRGIGSLVVPRFIGWVWEALPRIHRIEAQVYEGNERSVGVLMKAGFEREGRLRGKVWKDGEVRDLLVYGLVRG